MKKYCDLYNTLEFSKFPERYKLPKLTQGRNTQQKHTSVTVAIRVSDLKPPHWSSLAVRMNPRPESLSPLTSEAIPEETTQILHTLCPKHVGSTLPTSCMKPVIQIPKMRH